MPCAQNALHASDTPPHLPKPTLCSGLCPTWAPPRPSPPWPTSWPALSGTSSNIWNPTTPQSGPKPKKKTARRKSNDSKKTPPPSASNSSQTHELTSLVSQEADGFSSSKISLLTCLRLRKYPNAAETKQTTPEKAASIISQPVTTAIQPGTAPPAPRYIVTATKNAIAKTDAQYPAHCDVFVIRSNPPNDPKLSHPSAREAPTGQAAAGDSRQPKTRSETCWSRRSRAQAEPA